MASAQVTVTNSGDPIVVGGVTFQRGANTIRVETLELLRDLGLLNALMVPPQLSYDVTKIAAPPTTLAMTLSLAAAATITGP